jgi:hypothetical protein
MASICLETRSILVNRAGPSMSFPAPAQSVPVISVISLRVTSKRVTFGFVAMKISPSRVRDGRARRRGKCRRQISDWHHESILHKHASNGQSFLGQFRDLRHLFNGLYPFLNPRSRGGTESSRLPIGFVSLRSLRPASSSG